MSATTVQYQSYQHILKLTLLSTLATFLQPDNDVLLSI